MTFCNSCLAGKFVVINRKKTILVLNCIGVGAYYLVFLFCHMADLDAQTTIVLYSVVGVLFEITDSTVFMIQCKADMKEYWKFILIYFALPVSVATFIRILFWGN